jgi:hypothetical protein
LVIEESVQINADVRTAWKTFTDFTCWSGWCTSVSDMDALRCATPRPGARLSFRIRPFSIPLTITPRIDEVVEFQQIVWSGGKWGVRARHEFLFSESGGGSLLTSREVFGGWLIKSFGFLFPLGRLHGITMKMLNELRREAERRAQGED